MWLQLQRDRDMGLFEVLLSMIRGFGERGRRFAVLGCMLLAGQTWAGEEGLRVGSADPTGVSAMCERPITIGRLPGGAELDTVWYSFGPAFAGCRIVNRKHLWVVEDPWFGIVGNGRDAFKLAQLDSLHSCGQIGDSTRFVAVTHRYTIKADDSSDARRVARLKRPNHPPRAVRNALKRLAAEPSTEHAVN